MEVYRRSSGLLLLLGLSLLATTLHGVQGEVESEGPSESECRPYIEKALKELEAGEVAAGSSAEEGDGDSKEDIPTIEITSDDSPNLKSNGEKDDINEEDQDSNEDDQIVSEKIEPEVRPSVIQKISSFFQKVFQRTPIKKEGAANESKQSEDKQDDASQEENDQALVDDTDSKEVETEDDSKEKSKTDSMENSKEDSKEADTNKVTKSIDVQKQDNDDGSKEDDNEKNEGNTTDDKESKEKQDESKEYINEDTDGSRKDFHSQHNLEESIEVENEQESDNKEEQIKNTDKDVDQGDSLEKRIEAEIIENLIHTQIQEDDDNEEEELAADIGAKKESVEDQAHSEEDQAQSEEQKSDEDVTDNNGDMNENTNESVKYDIKENLADEKNNYTNEGSQDEAQERLKRSINDSVDNNEVSKEDDVNLKENFIDVQDNKVDSNEAEENIKGSDSNETKDDEGDKSDEKKESPIWEEEDVKDDKDSKEEIEEKSAENDETKKKDNDSEKDDEIFATQSDENETSIEDKKSAKSTEDKKDSNKEQGETDSREKDNVNDKKNEGEDGGPVEELSLDTDIPTDLRPRDHVEHLLKLDDRSAKTESIINKASEITLKDLKKLYENAIKPLEVLYKYRDLSNRHFGDSEIFSKPLILFMGPWSGGKSSIINYLTNNEYNDTSLRTGAEPSPAYFNILMYGEEPEVIDGSELAADFTFSGLQKFGQGLEERLRGIKLPSKLLEKVNIVEIPGILEVRKQVSRVFPFNDACQWFIDRGDIIFLIYDPSKLDVGPETEAILDQLKGREHQTRIILNKADQVKPEELMRVQGALIWNISPLMSSPQPPIMYTTSLWSRPYEPWAPVRLLQAQERAFLRDLRGAVDKRIENKIASARRFAVRVRNHAKMVDCYLTTYYNHKSVFGNRKQVADAIIDHPQDYHIYEGLSTLTNISRYDLPDPDVYRDFFKLNPLYEFQQLSATCTYFRGCPINRLDIAIAYDLPELLGTHRKRVESALTGGAAGLQQQTSAPGS